MGRLVLTESCVIQCAHGGTVQHPSSDSIRTIGGLKPNFTVDILGAPISGCPVPYTPCTCVAAISDAMTESNVVGASGTYALDVSGCQTDQGASLVVASRANSNSKTAKKASVNNSVEGEEGEEVPEHEKKKREEKERYNLYLLRKSTDNIKHEIRKPLRPSRPYIDVKYFYDRLETHPLISEKIVPFTLAFVYVKLADESIDEYRILSSGSLYGETFKDIQYKKEGEKDPYEYIPLYDGEKIEIAYSNVQLSSEQSKRAEAFSKLLTTEFDPTDTGKTKAESFFLKDPNAINSNRINLTTIKEQKKFDPVKAHEEKVKQAEAEGKSTDFSLYPLNSVVIIPDPFGEAEDMLNTYEWRYKKTFSANDVHIEDMKAQNAYPYAVSAQMDYFYVSDDEKAKVTELKKLFRKMADDVCQGSFAKEIIKGENDVTPLEELINPAYNTAVSYINEIKQVNASFFDNIFEGVVTNHRGRATEHHTFGTKGFKVSANSFTCEYVPLVDFTSVKEGNGYKRNRYAQKIGEYEKYKTPHHVYNRQTRQTITVPYRDIPYGYLVIDDNNELAKYSAYTKKPLEMLALLVFSFFFSKHYEKQAQQSEVYNDAKEFFYKLKNAPKLPPLSDQDRADVKKIIDAQKSSYAPICSKKNKLLEQYNSMDDLNRTYSFDFTKIKSPNEVFSDLYIPKEFTSFLNDGNTNPKDMLTQVRKFISSNEDLKTLLEAYMKIEEFDSNDQQREYINTMFGMVYTFMESKSRTDVEAQMNSPFNDDAKTIRDMIKHLGLLRQKIEDADLAAEVFMLPMRDHYTNVLQAHLLQTLGNEADTPQKANANALLKDPDFQPYLDESKSEFEMSNLNNLFFEKKQESEDGLQKLVAQFKAIDGYNAKFATLTKGNTNEVYSRSIRSDDAMDADTTREQTIDFKKLKENKDFYKALKLYRKTSANFSTLVLFAGVASGYIHWDKIKGADMYNLMLDTTKLTAKIGESVISSYAESQEAIQKALIKDTLKDISSLKLLAYAGIIGVIISTAYNVEKLDKDDIDGRVVTIAKGAITIGLLLVPLGGFVVVGLLVALEVAWVMFANIFIDTPLEAFVFRSLLFNAKGEDPKDDAQRKQRNRHYSHAKHKHPYEVKLLSHTFKEKLNATLQGFDSVKEIQNFIGDNYKANKDIFVSAMEYELTTLKAVAYGYKVDIQDTIETQKKVNHTLESDTLQFQTRLQIPKEILQNNIGVYFKVDGAYTNIYKGTPVAEGELPPMPTDFIYETAEPQTMKLDRMQLLAKKGAYIFIINKEIVLKYKIKYKLPYDVLDNGMSFQYFYTLEIDELELEPLDGQERQMIQNDTYGYMQQCEELTRQKERTSA